MPACAEQGRARISSRVVGQSPRTLSERQTFGVRGLCSKSPPASFCHMNEPPTNYAGSGWAIDGAVCSTALIPDHGRQVHQDVGLRYRQLGPVCTPPPMRFAGCPWDGQLYLATARRCQTQQGCGTASRERSTATEPYGATNRPHRTIPGRPQSCVPCEHKERCRDAGVNSAGGLSLCDHAREPAKY